MIRVFQDVLLLMGLMEGTSRNCAAQWRRDRRILPRSSVKGGRIAPFGALPHARMETEDPISAETGPTLQSESESESCQHQKEEGVA